MAITLMGETINLKAHSIFSIALTMHCLHIEAGRGTVDLYVYMCKTYIILHTNICQDFEGESSFFVISYIKQQTQCKASMLVKIIRFMQKSTIATIPSNPWFNISLHLPGTSDLPFRSSSFWFAIFKGSLTGGVTYQLEHVRRQRKVPNLYQGEEQRGI